VFPLDSKILVVEDSSFSRTVTRNGLKELGFTRIMEAADAKIAKTLFLESEQIADPFHLLVADIHMPEVSGLELVRWLREHKSLSEIPIIILTSSQDKKEVLEAGMLGVGTYMIKPFEVSLLKERLESTWQRQGEKYLTKLKAKPK
jgi:two-component system, chemotaxis family, chemotaxis protein CheY